MRISQFGEDITISIFYRRKDKANRIDIKKGSSGELLSFLKTIPIKSITYINLEILYNGRLYVRNNFQLHSGKIFSNQNSSINRGIVLSKVNRDTIIGKLTDSIMLWEEVRGKLHEYPNVGSTTS